MDVVVASRDHDLRLAIELLVGKTPGAAVVGTAAEGDGVLALVASVAPDAVVIDWDIACDDDHLLAGIRAGGSTPCVVVLGIHAIDRDRALAAGADRFVVKGGPPERLTEALVLAPTSP